MRALRRLGLCFIILLALIFSSCTDNVQPQPDNKQTHTGAPKETINAEITQVSLQKWIEIGYLWVNIAVEIKNTGSVPIRFRNCKIDLIGKDNAILDTINYVKTLPGIVMPSQTAYISEYWTFDEFDSLEYLDDIEVFFDYSATKSEIEYLEVKDLKASIEDKDVKVTGRILNSSGQDANDVEFAIALWGNDRKLLGVLKDKLTVPLKQGQETGFSTDDPPLVMNLDQIISMTAVAYDSDKD